jgi:non-heme chloroperoxidase
VADIEERFATGSGIKIRYLDNAPAAPVGLPILFSPGLTDFADEYLPMLEDLLPRRVLVVEVRGRGKSEAPPTGYAVADHVRDLEAVIEAESLDRFHLMTFSRGTSWAMEVAFADPSRVASLSIGDYQAFEMKLPDTFAETQMNSRFRGVQMVDRIQRHVIEGLAAESKARQLWDEIGALPVPLLVCHATEQGAVAGPGVVEKFRAARPDVEVVAVEGPHDLFRNDRLAYPRAVVEFIERRGLDAT